MSPTEKYDIQKLSEMIGTTEEKLSQAKEYILQYFYPTYFGIYFYNAQTRKFELLSHKGENVLQYYLPNGLETKVFDGDKAKKWSARKWLTDNVYDRWSIVLKLGAPAVDKAKKTINLMGNLKHELSQCKPYEEYSDDIRAKVDRFVEHIKVVWCSRHPEQYEFVLDWLSCTGNKKVKCALYLQSLEQTGKGMVIDFLQHHVFGKSLVLSTSHMEAISQYTAMLEGYALVNINEMPCASSGEWHKAVNAMKTLVTDDTFTSRQMYSQGRPSTNTFNMILTSNNNAVSIQYNNYQRYKCPDVSNEMIGNRGYFNKLGECMNDEVGEAFYVWLQNRYKKRGYKIQPEQFPNTDTFKDKVCETLDPVYNFIKFEFIKKGLGLNHALKALYKQYEAWYDDNNPKGRPIKSDKLFSKMLKYLEPTVENKRRTVVVGDKKMKCVVFTCEHKKLYQLFDKKGYIHELDEIEGCLEVESTASKSKVVTAFSAESSSESETESESVSASSTDTESELDAGMPKVKMHGKGYVSFD